MTKAQYFTLYSGGQNALQVYVQSGNQFVLMAPAVVVGWFDDAANGGANYQSIRLTMGAPGAWISTKPNPPALTVREWLNGVNITSEVR